MADEPELQQGVSGEWVQYLQGLLQGAGAWSGNADGEFGEELAEAVRQYQSNHGLSSTGVVDQQTWDALTGAASAQGEQGGQHGIEFSWEEFPELSRLYHLQSDNDVKSDLLAMGIDPDAMSNEGEAYA